MEKKVSECYNQSQYLQSVGMLHGYLLKEKKKTRKTFKLRWNNLIIKSSLTILQ